MPLKSFLFSKFSEWKVSRELKTHDRAVFHQDKFLSKLIVENKNTLFGKEHSFSEIKNVRDFQSNIPIRTYEEFLPYIDKLKGGEADVLTQCTTIYLLTTSGTTAGSKYIPISKSGLKYQIDAALKVLCFFAVNTNNADFMNYKMIFLQGSPKLDDKYRISSGRLSGVVYHHIPKFFQRNKLPRYEVNIIEDWQTKLDAIVDETLNEDISILGGIPPWCLQYFEKLILKSTKQSLKELYPNLAMYIHGGLDFSNYKEKMQMILGKGVHCLQTFPASEGFFAIQDALNIDDMLLLLNQGVFYEFRKFQKEGYEIVDLANVECNTRYELIITNDSGLYRYAIGDIIEFTSINPFRIKVVGRTSQFISAFGEHVIAYEVEKAMEKAMSNFSLKIDDYIVSPNIDEKCYEWRIEFPEDIVDEKVLLALSAFLDTELANLNTYYDHLLQGKIINTCRIIPIKKGTFKSLRKKNGKEGGQNKVVRLSNEKISNLTIT
jgi:hypothetical protein